jgi:hypothetical protein
MSFKVYFHMYALFFFAHLQHVTGHPVYEHFQEYPYNKLFINY